MMGGCLRWKVWLFLHHDSQTPRCDSASFSEERMSCPGAIWAPLSASILPSPLVPGQAAFPWRATRADCEITSRNRILQTDKGREHRHQAPTKLSLTFHALLSMPSLLLSSSFSLSLVRGVELKEHIGSCQLEVPAKNDPDLKFGALEDPVVPDDLAVEAEVARWMRKS